MPFAVTLLVAALIFIFRYKIKYLIARIRLKPKVKSLCKKYNAELFPNKRFWNWGNIADEKCEFFILKNKHLYAVKLCGAKSRGTIDFYDNTHYRTKSYGFHLASTIHSVLPVQKKKPAYRFQCTSKERIQQYPNIPILLMVPEPLNISYRKTNIGNGDDIGECKYYNLAGIEGLMSNDNNS